MGPMQSSSQSDRRFYTGMAVLSALTVFMGFAPTYFLRAASDLPPLTSLVKVHGFAFTSWMLLFIVQTSLIGLKRPSVHRNLGYAGAVLAVAMIPLGYLTAINAARHGHNPSPTAPDALAFLVIPLGDLVVFTPFVALAFWFRRRTEVHKRLMLLATVAGILPAAYSRLSNLAPVIVGFALFFLSAGPIYDRIVKGRIHPVSLWGGLIALLSVPLRIVIGQTEVWRGFAQWLIS
jgi:hypothetical protein